MNYETYMQSTAWASRRTQKLNEVDQRCQLCGTQFLGATGILECHHTHYENLYNEPLEDLMVLCRRCHTVAHMLREIRKDEYAIKDRVEKNFELYSELTNRVWWKFLQKAADKGLEPVEEFPEDSDIVSVSNNGNGHHDTEELQSLWEAHKEGRGELPSRVEVREIIQKAVTDHVRFSRLPQYALQEIIDNNQERRQSAMELLDRIKSFRSDDGVYSTILSRSRHLTFEVEPGIDERLDFSIRLLFLIAYKHVTIRVSRPSSKQIHFTSVEGTFCDIPNATQPIKPKIDQPIKPKTVKSKKWWKLW